MNKFLQFNNRTIYFKEINGEYYIAIKPICEILNVDYVRAYKNLTEDEELKDALSKQTMRDTKNRKQEMICLPEEFIYGWMFSLRSKSQELKQYRRKCYHILYQHFKGVLIGRSSLLKQKEKIENQIALAEKELADNPLYAQFVKLKKEQSAIAKSLKENDKQILEYKPNLFNL